ncbi:uncharacterized protein (DUF2141 family) [Lewinella aquimaris]|uniref:Uncharacterized protein (DUF2141 family) n=1 Tax=Neolewinella aquimaris TaxID=1835722 RepID=A0A840EBU6_9BACT|nr:DUF2141 domain-containing protein [Neolewinella aquimaris]MBB4079468.1 uncharacterized protein (DUF2141 family) [Neolewinella aquimaris]
MYYLLSILFLLTTAGAPQHLDLEILSSTAGGKVYVAVYDSPDGFENEESISTASRELTASAQSAELALQVPTEGDYVIAVFQDLNDNGTLDRNFIGVPTEPYGFGKLPPSKWRAPEFGEVATTVAGGGRMKIEVRHWREY